MVDVEEEVEEVSSELSLHLFGEEIERNLSFLYQQSIILEDQESVPNQPLVYQAKAVARYETVPTPIQLLDNTEDMNSQYLFNEETYLQESALQEDTTVMTPRGIGGMTLISDRSHHVSIFEKML